MLEIQDLKLKRRYLQNVIQEAAKKSPTSTFHGFEILLNTANNSGKTIKKLKDRKCSNKIANYIEEHKTANNTHDLHKKRRKGDLNKQKTNISNWQQNEDDHKQNQSE